MVTDEAVERWCLVHDHWWYPDEEKQAPEGYCYCCETKKPCLCSIVESENIEEEKW